MKVTHFRILVAVAFAALVASYIVPDYLASADPSIARLAQYDGYRALVRSNAFVVLPLVLALTACVGLAFFQNWGRYLYLAWVAYSVVMSFAYGYRVSSPIDSFLGAVGGGLDGVVLAVAFWSPLSGQFAKPRP